MKLVRNTVTLKNHLKIVCVCLVALLIPNLEVGASKDDGIEMGNVGLCS